eukprot:symbB.v1.2.009548.t1/scaffold604.1/size182248/6
MGTGWLAQNPNCGLLKSDQDFDVEACWALFWRCQSSSLRAATVRCLGLLLAINLPGVRPLFAVVQKKGSVSDEDKAYGDAWKVGPEGHWVPAAQGGPTARLSRLPQSYEAFYETADDAIRAQDELDGLALSGTSVRVTWPAEKFARKEPGLVNVQGVSTQVSDKEVREFLEQAGTVRSIRRYNDIRFGEVLFKSEDDAWNARVELDGSRLLGKVLRLELDCSTDYLDKAAGIWTKLIRRTKSISHFWIAMALYTALEDEKSISEIVRQVSEDLGEPPPKVAVTTKGRWHGVFYGFWPTFFWTLLILVGLITMNVLWDLDGSLGFGDLDPRTSVESSPLLPSARALLVTRFVSFLLTFVPCAVSVRIYRQRRIDAGEPLFLGGLEDMVLEDLLLLFGNKP